MLSYTYNRLYTVGSPATFEPYRNKTGLTLMRHYSLNENEMTDGNDEVVGYFIMDVERAGPYCMMAEARAMAYGDLTQYTHLKLQAFVKLSRSVRNVLPCSSIILTNPKIYLFTITI